MKHDREYRSCAHDLIPREQAFTSDGEPVRTPAAQGYVHVPGKREDSTEDPPARGNDPAEDWRVRPSADEEKKKQEKKKLGLDGGSELFSAESSHLKPAFSDNK